MPPTSLTGNSILDLFFNIHPYFSFVVLLLAVIFYRFIPQEKKVDLRNMIPSTLVRYKGESPVNVTVRNIMIVIVTTIVLSSALYTILSGGYDEGTRNWAFGSAGMILGFWLKK